MKKFCVIACSSIVLQACSLITLRPAVTGIVTDSITALPLKGVHIYSDSGSNKAAVTDTNGRFFIAAIQQNRVNIPGEERDRLSPNANILVVEKAGYKPINVSIDDHQLKKTSTGIDLGTIHLSANQTK